MSQVPSESTLVSGMMGKLEDSYMHVFATLVVREWVSSEVFEDYLEFCEVARKIFTELGGDFSLHMVYEKLPENLWYPLYQFHVEQFEGFQTSPTVH